MGDSNSNIFSITSDDKNKNAFECAKDALRHRNLSGCSKIVFCNYEDATITYGTSSWDSSYSYKVSGTVTYYDKNNMYNTGSFNVELQLTDTGYENAYPYLF